MKKNTWNMLMVFVMVFMLASTAMVANGYNGYNTNAWKEMSIQCWVSILGGGALIAVGGATLVLGIGALLLLGSGAILAYDMYVCGGG
jgi:hypothetical protein